jgi:DNA-directed RNA polymerase subunit RPC12/RpoP
MSTYREPKRSDWTKSLLFIGIYVAAISITAFLLLTNYWYIWLAFVAGGMLLLVLWHKKSTAYHCPKCGNDFEISFLTDLVSPHGVTKDGGGWIYLKCPKCQNRSKMKILMKNNNTSD